MTPRPRARRSGLIVQELDDEVLVYDTERNKAHCLNRTAALVWRACDGRTPVREMAHRLRGALALHGEGETLVLEALRRLQQAHLLERSAAASAATATPSRRDALHRLGRLAGAASILPVITSIVAPRAAEAASCQGLGESCTAPAQCCPNNQNRQCCRSGLCANGEGNCIGGN